MVKKRNVNTIFIDYGPYPMLKEWKTKDPIKIKQSI